MVQMRRVLSEGSSEFDAWQEVIIPENGERGFESYDHHFVEEFYHRYYTCYRIMQSNDLALWDEGNYSLKDFNEDFKFSFKNVEELKIFQEELERGLMESSFVDLLSDVISGVLQFRKSGKD